MRPAVRQWLVDSREQTFHKLKKAYGRIEITENTGRWKQPIKPIDLVAFMFTDAVGGVQGRSAYIFTGNSTRGGTSGNPCCMSDLTILKPARSNRSRNFSSRLLPKGTKSGMCR